MKGKQAKWAHMSKGIFFAISIVMLTMFVSENMMAQKVRQPRAGVVGTWRLIGSTEANFTADHDGIVVAGPFDDFRKIKFKVTDAPLRLVKLVVTYDDGEPDNIETAFDIPEGGESRIIDLRGIGKRSVRRIDFWYDTKGILRGKANVTVFGMK